MNLAVTYCLQISGYQVSKYLFLLAGYIHGTYYPCPDRIPQFLVPSLRVTGLSMSVEDSRIRDSGEIMDMCSALGNLPSFPKKISPAHHHKAVDT